jgi:hypothetical protein
MASNLVLFWGVEAGVFFGFKSQEATTGHPVMLVGPRCPESPGGRYAMEYGWNRFLFRLPQSFQAATEDRNLPTITELPTCRAGLSGHLQRTRQPQGGNATLYNVILNRYLITTIVILAI